MLNTILKIVRNTSTMKNTFIVEKMLKGDINDVIDFQMKCAKESENKDLDLGIVQKAVKSVFEHKDRAYIVAKVNG